VSPRATPLDDLWWWLDREHGLAPGFTWRGPDGTNDFSPAAAERAQASWERVVGDLGASALVQCEQVHGAQVATLTTPPLSPRLVVPLCDALVTTSPGVAVAVRVADCLPLLLWCPCGVVAAVHAGWRGLAAGVIAKALREIERLGFAPGDLWAALGPAIGPCCFQIRPDVAEKLRALPDGGSHVTRRQGAVFADLPGLARAALMSLGVPEGHIKAPGACTRHDAERFFSYRRDGQTAGRQVGAIALVARDYPAGFPPANGP